MTKAHAPGLTRPRLVTEVKPTYTQEAMDRKVQGTTYLKILIDTAGHVSDVRIMGTFDPSLDYVAVGTVRKWTFSPAQLDGKAVPVVVDVEMQFKLR